MFSATDEPPKEMPCPPSEPLPFTAPGASSATAVMSRSTGSRDSSSRVMLVADSVDFTSTIDTTCGARTSTVPSVLTAPSGTFTVVALPRLTVTWPTRLAAPPGRLTSMS
ncbi:hypothetical protein D3C81_1007560 [compost metagenome]